MLMPELGVFLEDGSKLMLELSVYVDDGRDDVKARRYVDDRSELMSVYVTYIV